MPRSKSKKTKTKKVYTKRLMNVNKCMNKTLKQIRKSEAYHNLIPFGVGKRRSANPNKKYHFGSKSTMRKQELCEALSNPKAYHNKLKKAYGTGKRKQIKNTGRRKRFSRTGDCRPYKRKPPCKGSKKNEGVTTTGQPCCYKKKQSAATKRKRLANKKKMLSKKKTYNSKIRKHKYGQKNTGKARKSTKSRKKSRK